MASWWSVGDVLVQPRGVSVFVAQVRLSGAWAGMYVRHVVSASYFIGVAVAFKPYFWWCMRGLLLVGVLLVLAWRFLVARRRHVSSYMGCILDISIVSCICAHGRATQHQTILHACGP